MQFRTNSNVGGGGSNPFNSLISLLMFGGVLLLLFFLVKSFFTLLYWVAPVLLVITLIINYRVVRDYAAGIVTTLQSDVLLGMVKVAFTVLCYPLVIGWLFAKALIYRKVNTLQQDFQKKMTQSDLTQDVDYEEVSSEKLDKTDEKPPQKPIIIQLPKPKEKDKSNPYDDIFES
jgi:predicted membrane protein